MAGRNLDEELLELTLYNPLAAGLDTDLDLLLVGKTGNGKSATGNSILGGKYFTSHASTESVTREVQSEVVEYRGKKIKVVDGPGLGDTRITTDDELKNYTGKIEKAMLYNPRGFHALLLVVRFGGRYDQGEQDVLTLLKTVFGHDFVYKFCIVLMTCGDNYDEEEEGCTFDKWCEKQRGPFAKLRDECAGRVILFNNRTKNQTEKEAQTDRLIRMVLSLQNQQHRYTNESFTRAATLRAEALKKAGLPLLQQELLQEISLILQNLAAIDKMHHDGRRPTPRDTLQPLSARCGNLIKILEKCERLPKDWKDLLSSLIELQRAIDSTLSSGRWDSVWNARDKVKKCYREANSLSILDIMIKALGWTAFVVGLIIIPEVMFLFWAGSAIYKAVKKSQFKTK